MTTALNATRMLSSRVPLLHKVNVGQSFYQNALFTTSANKWVKLKVVPPNDTDKLSYEEKNSLLKRAQSPHMTIYKFPLPALMSGNHRLSGLVLTGIATGLCGLAVLPPNDISYWLTAFEGLQLSTASLACVKFSLALPATYHTCNGVRHLIWDTGKFLEMDKVYKTGYIVLGLSFASALILATM